MREDTTNVEVALTLIFLSETLNEKKEKHIS